MQKNDDPSETTTTTTFKVTITKPIDPQQNINSTTRQSSSIANIDGSNNGSSYNINNRNMGNNNNNATIRALVRGIHDTGIKDINSLHLPLMEDVVGEANAALNESQENLTTKTTSTLKLSTPTSSRRLSSPPSLARLQNTSLPRLVLNMGTGGDSEQMTPRSMTPEDDITRIAMPVEMPTSPGRRFSQFNFNLRRFSHAHTGVCYKIQKNRL